MAALRGKLARPRELALVEESLVCFVLDYAVVISAKLVINRAPADLRAAAIH